ncbi:MAG: phosphate regulon transcriptional regulator PhoB [Rhizobiales bacterium]|nr:phosphate regulon transcriptional regulator PhoB [Hyphomicrobiales bacterium]
MPARILIVEDEEALSILLKYNLEAEGFDVSASGSAEDAELQIEEELPDLIILDWMLPGLSGIELCRRLRSRKNTKKVPILMLTARGEETERVRGLNTGADDYMVKPFSVPELMARVKALLRRVNPEIVSDILVAGELELHRLTHRVYRAGTPLDLGPTEFRLLEYLMQSPGRVRTRTQMLDAVWGRDIYVEERTVDVHVGRLRKILSKPGDRDPIRTVRGTGYAFDESF